MHGPSSRWNRKALWTGLLAIVLVALGLGAAGLPIRSWLASRPPRPLIEVSDLHVDFGRLKPLEEVERVVTVENRGGQTLRLVQPTATCGCQKPILGHRVLGPDERIELGPGERIELHLRQQAKQASGPFQHIVTLKSNDPKTPETLIYLGGVVSRGVIIRPEPLVFEPLMSGETQTRYLEVVSDNGRPFRLIHQHANGHLRVKAKLDRPGTLHRIAVTLRGGETCGFVRESFILNTDIPDGQPLIIGVAGEVVGPVRVAPKALTLGTVHGYQEVTRKILLSGSRGPFQLKNIAAPSGGWRLRYQTTAQAAKGHSQVVDLAIRVPNRQGVLSGVIQIETQAADGRMQVLALPISGVIASQVASAANLGSGTDEGL